jgi:hypothetical protein
MLFNIYHLKGIAELLEGPGVLLFLSKLHWSSCFSFDFFS